MMKTAIFMICLLSQALFATEAPVILDVRTPAEFAHSHLKGAKNLDYKDPKFAEWVKQLDPGKPYLIYCRTGNRSGQAIELMQSLGFKDLKNLGGVGDAAKTLAVKCEGKTDQCS